MLRIAKFSAWISWLVNDSASSILPEPNTLLSIGYLGPRRQLHKKVNDIGRLGDGIPKGNEKTQPIGHR